MNKKLFVAGLGLALLFMFGCSTPEKVSRMEGQGPSRIYNAPYDATWKAAVDSAWGLGLTVLRVYPKEGFISAKRGMTATTFGEDVGIWLKDAGTGKTQVEVVSRQKGIPVIERKWWEEDVFRAIAERLGSPPVAQGSAPGQTTIIRASESQTVAKPAPIAPLAPSVQTGATPPAAKALRAVPAQEASAAPKASTKGQDPLTEQLALREQLRRYLTSKEADFQKETEPKRRQLIQYEMDYIREELNKLDARLSNVPR